MTIATAKEFVALRASEDLTEQRRASHEEAEDGVWEEVIASYPDMRFWVAQNKTVPLEILRILAKDDDPRVRDMVARKRKLSAELLETLANDSSDSVRMAVVRHPRASEVLLRRLLEDPWAEVRKVALSRLAESEAL